jgi:DNA-binding MarR family transcriptional regulator
MPRTLAQEVGKRDPFKSRAQEAFLNVIRTGAMLDGPFKTLFRKHGLSPTTYNLLRILRGHQSHGCRCSILRDQLVVRVPDITRLVDRLCDAKFVTRKPDPKDARAVIVRITAKGLRILDTLDQQVMQLHTEQLGHLSNDELDTLNRLLEKAREHL